MLMNITLSSVAELSLSISIGLLPFFLMVGICTWIHLWVRADENKKTMEETRNMLDRMLDRTHDIRRNTDEIDTIYEDVRKIREMAESLMQEEDEVDTEENNP
jgi:hypothetical protein